MRTAIEIQREMQSELSQLEAHRAVEYAKYSKGGKLSLFLILVFVGIGAMLIAMTTLLWVGIGIIVVGAIGVAIYYWFKVYSIYRDYYAKFKDTIVSKVVKMMVPEGNMLYIANSMIPPSLYHESQIYLTDDDRYHGEDYIGGVIGQTHVMLSELHTEYKTESRSNNGTTTTHWHTIFKGIFIVADCHKHFNGKTHVLPDQSESFFGKLLGKTFQKWNFSRDDLVYLENPDFEKQFVVYSNDQQEARYLITPKMMERMMELKARFNSEVAFSFVNTKMFVAIPTDKNSFEPKFSKPIDSEAFNKLYEEVRICLEVVDVLDLNTRIWGK